MQLIKHHKSYGMSNKKIIVQPTYLTRLFDYYMGDVYILKDRFDVNWKTIKDDSIIKLMLDLNDVDYIKDYYLTIMTAIHIFLVQHSLNFNYIQIEQYGNQMAKPELLLSQKSFEIPNIDLKYIPPKQQDLYKKVTFPIKNKGHMSALDHLDVAKKIVKHLELPDITSKTIDIVNNIHDYFCTTHFIDIDKLQKMIHNK
jgi:hypothetical protein